MAFIYLQESNTISMISLCSGITFPNFPFRISSRALICAIVGFFKSWLSDAINVSLCLCKASFSSVLYPEFPVDVFILPSFNNLSCLLQFCGAVFSPPFFVNRSRLLQLRGAVFTPFCQSESPVATSWGCIYPLLSIGVTCYNFVGLYYLSPLTRICYIKYFLQKIPQSANFFSELKRISDYMLTSGGLNKKHYILFQN